MASDTADSTLLLDAAGRVAQNVPCRHCGYNLRGLSPAGNCPECGRLIDMSLRGGLLVYANADWLGRLTGGLTWLIWSLEITILKICFLSLGLPGWSVSVDPGGARGAYLVSFAAAELTRAIGAWKATSPDPRTAGVSSTLDARLLARVLLIAYLPVPWIASFHLTHLQSFLLAIGADGIVAAGCIALWIHLARIAMRIPAPRLVRATHCAIAALVLFEAPSVAGVLCAYQTLRPATAAPQWLRWADVTLGWGNIILSLLSAMLPLVLTGIYRRQFTRVLRQL